MVLNRTLRVLSVFHVFYYFQEVQVEELLKLLPMSRKTLQRDMNFLKQAGLIRPQYDREAKAYIPLSTKDAQPEFPEKGNQRRYMEHIIRLAHLMTAMDEDNPPAWYRAHYPELSERTRKRDFALLRELGFQIDYDTDLDGGGYVCYFPDGYDLATFQDT